MWPIWQAGIRRILCQQRLQWHRHLGCPGNELSREFIAVCVGAKDSQSPSHATVQGINGYIKLTSAPNTSRSVELCINNELSTTDLHAYENHMVNELRAFHAMFAQHDYPACYKQLEHSLVVLEVLTQARQQAGIHFDADGNRALQ